MSAVSVTGSRRRVEGEPEPMPDNNITISAVGQRLWELCSNAAGESPWQVLAIAAAIPVSPNCPLSEVGVARAKKEPQATLAIHQIYVWGEITNEFLGEIAINIGTKKEDRLLEGTFKEIRSSDLPLDQAPIKLPVKRVSLTHPNGTWSVSSWERIGQEEIPDFLQEALKILSSESPRTIKIVPVSPTVGEPAPPRRITLLLIHLEQ